MRMRFVFMRGEDLRDEGEGASVREWNGDGGHGYGCGASMSKPVGIGAGQESGCQTHALSYPTILLLGSDKGARLLAPIPTG